MSSKFVLLFEHEYMVQVYEEVYMFEDILSRPPKDVMTVLNSTAFNQMKQHINEAKRRINDLEQNCCLLGIAF